MSDRLSLWKAPKSTLRSKGEMPVPVFHAVCVCKKPIQFRCLLFPDFGVFHNISRVITFSHRKRDQAFTEQIAVFLKLELAYEVEGAAKLSRSWKSQSLPKVSTFINPHQSPIPIIQRQRGRDENQPIRASHSQKLGFFFLRELLKDKCPFGANSKFDPSPPKRHRRRVGRISNSPRLLIPISNDPFCSIVSFLLPPKRSRPPGEPNATAASSKRERRNVITAAMADAGYLEKMGRELKCPICLSLLESAVSLACNHVFCNACIVKSMKSGLNCPVCKVPYRRREVRPAPHMDNLVSIYKNMEIASGINFFVSQNPAFVKSADEVKKDGEKNHLNTDEVPAQGVSTNPCKTYKRRSRKEQAFDCRDRSVQPSCPTKKRIQVPQHPPFSVPIHAESANVRFALVDGNKADNSLEARSQKSEQFFQPFFWLRDDEDADDANKGSQYSEKDRLTDSSSVKTPCFSDIKDTEDDVAVNSAAMDFNTISNPLNLYDSELFEWTQRPCSPELCSSPLGNQLAEASERIIEDKSPRSYADKSCDDVQLGAAADNVMPTEEPSLIDDSNFTESAMPKKRGRKAGRKLQRKSISSDIDQPAAVRSKTAITSISQTMPTCDQVSAEILDEVNRTNIQEVPETQEGSKETNVTTRESPTTTKNVTDAKKRICVMGQKELGPQKRGRRSRSVVSKADAVGGNRKEPSSAEDPCNTSVEVPISSTKGDKSSNSCTKMVLQKCRTVLHVQCAFCHSSECSEASGEMVTYKDGELMAEGCLAIAMRVHKNCAEWAPNVYFDDNKAINLDAELARSRRIACSCCGIKGAALGCFEKSCRKSFHVTCAKLMPQCRWDNVNFVMLCPLHASSKLPIETSRPQDEDTGKSCSSKGNVKVAQDNVSKRDHRDSSWNQTHNKSCSKMVLCCSSLTDTEQEIVSKFVNASRATVLPKWDLSVTHVIASQDENKACKRTLKVLMGILEGKWILNVDWIRECIEAKEYVDVNKYEINLDTRGMKNGPRLGRLRVLNKKPKLFERSEFYFTGDFVHSYKGYLQDLVTAAGGTVLHRKPVPGSASQDTFVIYSLEVPGDCETRSKRADIINRRLSEAEALAGSTAAKVASNSWLLDSIAAYKKQPL